MPWIEKGEVKGRLSVFYKMNMRDRKKIVIIILLVIVLAIAGGVFGYKLFQNNPKRIMAKALTKLSNDLDTAVETGISPVDMDLLAKCYSTGDFKADFNISIKNKYYSDTTNMEGDCAYDTTNKRMLTSTKIALGGTSLTTVKLYADDKKVYMMYPDLIKGSFMIPIEEYADGMFQKPAEGVDGVAALSNHFEKDVLKAGLTAKVEKIENSDNYEITIMKDVLNSNLSENMQLESDLVLQIFMDGENITEITNNDRPIRIGDMGKVTIDLKFIREGENITESAMIIGTDEISANYGYQYAEGISDIVLEYEEDGIEGKMVFRGKIRNNEDVVKLDITELKLFIDGTLTTDLSGLMHMSALDKPVEKPDTDPEYDLMNMTTEDFMDIISEAGTGIMDLLQ